MEYRALGRTDLRVSRLGMGTAALGMRYGISTPDQDDESPEIPAGLSLVREAVNKGIVFFDTAPAYGESERILGAALSSEPSCVIATKVLLPEGASTMPSDSVESFLRRSLSESRSALGRSVLDVVQIHNAEPSIFRRKVVFDVLEDERSAGAIRFIGATTYGEEAALAAIESNAIDVLQIACSILDQRLCDRVLPAARKARIGIIARSVLLKGVLTPRANHLPKELDALRQAAARIREAFDVPWARLPRVAIRYCLGLQSVDVAIVGLRTTEELTEALAAVDEGPLSSEEMSKARTLRLEEERLLNPAHWNIP